MSAIVCDASVLVKLLVSEPDSHLALALVESSSVILPDFAVLEVANTLWSRVHAASSSADEANRLLREFEGFNFDIRTTASHIQRSLDLANHLNHPIYDCVYLALAESLAVPLVTADRRFFTALRRAGALAIEVRSLTDVVLP